MLLFQELVKKIQAASPEEIKDAAITVGIAGAAIAWALWTNEWQKTPEEIRRPGDPVVWPWSK